MAALAQCLSHSPAASARPLEAKRDELYRTAIDDGRRALAEFAPDVVVVFGPDHYNGFFYQLMPQFCLGMRAIGIGDYGTPKGELAVDAVNGGELHSWLLDDGFDVAVSHEMHIDHGFTQSLQQLFDKMPAFIPIFINCVAEPVTGVARSMALGRSVGRFFARRGQKPAFIGSGGLSHDAPLPRLQDLDEETRRQFVRWRQLDPAARAAREQRTLAAADAFARGESALRKLNPDWDQRVMRQIAAGQWDVLEAMKDSDITEQAGRSGHEVRTWLAAFSALDACEGGFTVEQCVYFDAPEWIVGFGALRGQGV